MADSSYTLARLDLGHVFAEPYPSGARAEVSIVSAPDVRYVGFGEILDGSNQNHSCARDRTQSPEAS